MPGGAGGPDGGTQGGIAGGLIQGIVGPLVLRRGYPFPDIAMITGGLFLRALTLHAALGGLFGGLVGAIARSGAVASRGTGIDPGDGPGGPNA